MSRRFTRSLGVALAVVAAGCSVEGRGRDLLGPEGGAGEGLARDPIVRITAPGDGSLLARRDFLEPPGVRVQLGGRFVTGHSLDLRAYAPGYGPIPFHHSTAEIVEESPPVAVWVLGNPSFLNRTSDVKLYLRLHDDADRLISVDSVRVHVR